MSGTIRRIPSGGTYEDKVGYCRVVVAGDFVFVSGCVAAGPEVPAGVVDQCRSALGVIERALAAAGCGFADVVRVTYMLPDRRDFEPCWPLLRERFGAHPPAATMIECGLVDPRYRIEIEVTALLPQGR